MAGGRKPKLTRALIERASDLLEQGCYIETTARVLGIHPSTFHRWVQLGQEPDARPLFREFCEAVEGASARAELRAVQSWQAAFDKDWRAAARFLERRFAARWGAGNGTTNAEGAPGDNLLEILRSGAAEPSEWANKGFYLQPHRALLFDASGYPGSLADRDNFPKDSEGRQLWPATVTLDMLTREERAVFELVGLAPWDVESQVFEKLVASVA